MSEEATITKVIEATGYNAGATENGEVRTTTHENSEEGKTSSEKITSHNFDVSDNSNIMSPPPKESPLLPPRLPLIVVG